MVGESLVCNTDSAKFIHHLVICGSGVNLLYTVLTPIRLYEAKPSDLLGGIIEVPHLTCEGCF